MYYYLVIKNLDPDPELMNMYWLSILVLIFFPVFSIQFVYDFLSVPAYYLNTDPDPGSQLMRIHADPNPDPGQTRKLQKVKFLT